MPIGARLLLRSVPFCRPCFFSTLAKALYRDLSSLFHAEQLLHALWTRLAIVGTFNPLLQCFACFSPFSIDEGGMLLCCHGPLVPALLSPWAWLESFATVHHNRRQPLPQHILLHLQHMSDCCRKHTKSGSQQSDYQDVTLPE